MYLRGCSVPRRNNVQAARGCRPRDARAGGCDESEVRCQFTGQRAGDHGERWSSNSSIALEKRRSSNSPISLEEWRRANASLSLEERRGADSIALEVAEVS